MSAFTHEQNGQALVRAREFVEQTRPNYTIYVQHDLRPRRLRPWSATMTHALFHIGYPYSKVWRAHSREKLIAKCERWIARDAARQGIPAPQITVDG